MAALSLPLSLSEDEEEEGKNPRCKSSGETLRACKMISLNREPYDQIALGICRNA